MTIAVDMGRKATTKSNEECIYENFETLTFLFKWMDAHIYENICVSYFFMRNEYIKFLNPNLFFLNGCGQARRNQYAPSTFSKLGAEQKNSSV